MPTVTTTTWPTGATLLEWIGGIGAVTPETAALLEDVVADATAGILERIDERKLPLDESCPRSVSRAIILSAARLLSRKDSSTGIVAFGDFGVRLATVDVDVKTCLHRWGLDPEP